MSANGFNEEQAFGEHSDPLPTTSNNSKFHLHAQEYQGFDVTLWNHQKKKLRLGLVNSRMAIT